MCIARNVFVIVFKIAQAAVCTGNFIYATSAFSKKESITPQRSNASNMLVFRAIKKFPGRPSFYTVLVLSR